MQLPVRVMGEQAVHEVKEFDAPPALVVTGPDEAGGHFQCGEECGCAVALRMS